MGFHNPTFMTMMQLVLIMSRQNSVINNDWDAVLQTVQLYSKALNTPSHYSTLQLASALQFKGPMEPEQLSSYLNLLDLPLQLDSSPHPANLALIQSRHLMRIPYQSRCNPVPVTWLQVK